MNYEDETSKMRVEIKRLEDIKAETDDKIESLNWKKNEMEKQLEKLKEDHEERERIAASPNLLIQDGLLLQPPFHLFSTKFKSERMKIGRKKKYLNTTKMCLDSLSNLVR